MKFTKKYGGVVKLIPLIGNISTTKLAKIIVIPQNINVTYIFKRLKKANCVIIHIPALKRMVKQYENEIKKLRKQNDNKKNK